MRFAQTGKLSFRDMANAIIADLARIAAKQAAVGVINAVAGAWGGGVTAAGNAAATTRTRLPPPLTPTVSCARPAASRGTS